MKCGNFPLWINGTILVGLYCAIFIPVAYPQQGLRIAECAESSKTHENLNAVLWGSTSVEFRHAAIQAFRLAASQLKEALSDPTWTAATEQEGEFGTRPPAVILDVDETVLDNSPAQAATLVNATGMFSDAEWAAWVEQAKAKEIPGAAEFLHAAAKQGVHIFYVTNREKDQEAATIRNLKAVGFPFADEEHVMVKNEQEGWGSDKTSRRRYVADRYRVLLLLGDDANDFVGGMRGDVRKRSERLQSHEAHLGTKWILIPNPTYGSWENALWGGGYPTSRNESLKTKCEVLEEITGASRP